MLVDNYSEIKNIKEGIMNITASSVDTSLDDMFQRMGELLKDMAASRTGMSDEINEIRKFHRISQPGLGEKFDLSA